jgi:hypothetical protein
MALSQTAVELRKPHGRSVDGTGRGGIFRNKRWVFQPKTQSCRFDVYRARCLGDTALPEQRGNRLFRAAGKFRAMPGGPRLSFNTWPPASGLGPILFT